MITREDSTVEAVDEARRRYFEESPLPMAELDRTIAERLVAVATGQAAAGSADGSADGICAPCPGFASNRAMVRLMGARDADALQEHIGLVVPPERVDDLARFGSAALADGESEVTLALRKVDGLSVVLRLHASVPSGDGEPMLLSATEVTGDAEFFRQLNLLALLPELNPNMVFVVDGATDVAYTNPAARAWLLEHDLAAGEALERFEQKPSEALEDDSSSRSHTVDFEDGRRYRVDSASVAGVDRRMITVTDVTDVTRLRAEHDLFERAFNATTNPMLITDADGRIEHINDAFTAHYGYTADEARGENPRILNPGRATYRDLGVSDEEYDELFTTMRERLADEGHFEGELANECAHGYVSWIKVVLTRIDLGDGMPAKHLGVHVDVGAARRREEATRLEILQTIARVGELRDNETGRHMRRVGLYARRLAETLGMPAKYCTDIENQAPLHDIGKVGISDTILLAPRKLTAQEFEIIERHTTLGYSILAESPSMEMAAAIALGHHEKYNGRGYPFALEGEQIPLAARIVALVDVYDALRSDRPYKQAWDHESTRAEIVGLAGAHFCPDVIAAFEKIESDFKQISITHTDE
jgi:PAS domain S-box-containing protein